MKFSLINILFLVVGFLIGGITAGVVGYNASLKTTKVVVELQKETIQQAIAKNTTEISNNISNEFRKIKGKKSEPINIVIDNATKSVITSDTSRIVTVEKKRGFFKRIFNKNKN